jgi:hypothetical protein
MTEQEHGSVAMGDSVETVARAIHFRGSKQDDKAWNHCQPYLRETARQQARAAIAALYARPVQEPVDGLTISQAEVKALLYGVPKFEFSQALTRLAAWLAELDDTAPQPAHGTSATERVLLMEEPVGKQWCVYEDGEQRTSWYYVGQREGDAPGWEKAEASFPDIYQIKTRLLYAGPVVEDAE